MTQHKKYRLEPSAPAKPVPAHGLPRWTLALLIPVGTLLAMTVIAGAMLPVVLSTLFNMAWAMLVLIPAAMLGLAFTYPLRYSTAFAASIWPDGYRLVIACALGLGALSLGTLAFGSLHLLAGFLPDGLLVLAGITGYPASRGFLQQADYSKLKKPLSAPFWWLLLACLPLALLLVAACFPAGSLWHTEGNGYDVLEYHLQLPRQFLKANSTAPLRGNIYSFLPLNIEMLYLLLGTVAKSLLHDRIIYVLVYGSQMLHAAIVVLAGLGLALSPIRLGMAGRVVALLLFLCTPWTLVIGSLAYNDGGVLLYGALAFGLACADVKWPNVLIMGILLGLAVGCKMTSGVLVAVPVAAMLLARRRIGQVAIISLVALALYAPWMARSMIATHTQNSPGNPIFPIFSGTLGRGTWSKSLAHRFDRGHRPPPREASVMGHARALLSQTLLNRQWSPGLAAYYDAVLPIPRFPTTKTPWPLRMGLLWLLVIPVVILSLFTGPTAWLLTLGLVVQLFAWLICTQLQARFSLPIILPMALLVGLTAEFRPRMGQLFRGLLVAQSLFCLLLLRPETGLFLGPINSQNKPLLGDIFTLPADWIFDANGMQFPAHATWYMEGDSATLYMRGHYLYNTVFNRNPLARVLAAKGPAAALHWLQIHKIDYVILDWPEVYRLRATYGFNPIITPRHIEALVQAGLEPVPVKTINGIQIFRVPSE